MNRRMRRSEDKHPYGMLITDPSLAADQKEFPLAQILMTFSLKDRETLPIPQLLTLS